MQHGFIQKLLISVIIAFAMASLVQFYKHFIIGADRALNEGYNNRYGISK